MKKPTRRGFFASTTALLLSACAYTPSMELVRAQEAYRQAKESETAQIAPAELHQAKGAVDQAAVEDKDNQGSDEAKTKIYVAERKIAWARAVATRKIAMQQKETADKTLVESQDKLLTQQREQLVREQNIKDRQAESLTQKSHELLEAKSETEKERQNAMEAAALASRAQDREADALAKLREQEKIAEDARGQVVTLPSGLMFKTNQSTLLATAYPRLDEVAVQLQKMPNRYLLIEGHTDATGSDTTNVRLSTRRAEAVRDYLVSRGVDGSRVRIQGAGKSRPVADNTSTEGRAMNRRVEIVILNDSQDKAAAK